MAGFSRYISKYGTKKNEDTRLKEKAMEVLHFAGVRMFRQIGNKKLQVWIRSTRYENNRKADR